MAYAMGAVLPDRERATSVLCNNYIQLETAESPTCKAHLVRLVPIISPSTFSKCKLGPQQKFLPANASDLLHAIVISLRKHFYVRLLVDEFFIPDRWRYGKQHGVHDVLVIGADPSQRMLTLIGYCSDGRYKTSSCGFQELCTAFFALPQKKLDSFIAFRYSAEHVPALNPAHIASSLAGFLECKSDGFDQLYPSIAPTCLKSSRRYGLNCFDFVQEYLRSLPSAPTYIDRRPFSLIYEHAMLMEHRSTVLFSPKNCSQEHQEMKGFLRSATTIASRLKLMSLVSDRRASIEHITFMQKLCRDLRDFSEKGSRCMMEGISRL